MPIDDSASLPASVPAAWPADNSFSIKPYYCYDSVSQYTKDIRYMMSLYPHLLAPLLVAVNDACDRYMGEGSFLFHAYPDKERLLRIVWELYMEFAGTNEAFTTSPVNPWLMSLVQVLFTNELLLRRNDLTMLGLLP